MADGTRLSGPLSKARVIRLNPIAEWPTGFGTTTMSADVRAGTAIFLPIPRGVLERLGDYLCR